MSLMRKTIPFLLLLLCMPCLAFAPAQSAEQPPAVRKGKDYALFFANDDYSSHPGFGNLKNPVKDARAIARELEEMYGFEEAKVYENYSRNQIYQVLQQWQKRSFAPDGQLFIFFSGHGDFWEFTQKGYFVPKTNASDYSAYIELTDLGNIVTQIPCRHILLAVDACYSGAIDQAIVFKGRSFSRPNDTPPDTERDNVIYNQLRNQSRLLITSGGKQRTPDGKEHSPFAGAILDGLRAAYTYGDGLLTFTDLLGKLERASPTPHQGELPKHEQGGFVFVASAPPRAQPKVIPPDNMVYIQGGSFEMGDTFGDGGSDEKPPHTVTVSDFEIGRHEVTVGEYLEFVNATGKNHPEWMEKGSTYHIQTGTDDHYKKLGPALTNDKNPIVGISWNDAVAYCNWLSEQHGYQKVYSVSGSTVTADWNANGYRLPTEAEWEYAARSRGKKYKYAWGNDSTPHANIADESAKKQYSGWTIWEGYNDGYIYTSPVGKFEQGDLGLSDMTGNVWEWCWDWYDSGYYEKSKNSRDPKGPDSGSSRVIRGGSWYNYPALVRVANRISASPERRNDLLGFRLARAVR